VPIVFTGLRPGEKLFEELTYEMEETVPTSLEKVRVVDCMEGIGSRIVSGVDRLATCARMGDADNLLRVLWDLVPEYRAPLEIKASPTLPRVPDHGGLDARPAALAV